MSGSKPVKPGTPSPESGQYERVGPRGGKITGSTEITSVRGKPMPPTPEAGQAWKLSDATKHKN